MAKTNDLAAGDYIVLCAANTGCALDVAGASTADRGNVQIWERLNNEAQMWSLSYRADGSAQLVSRWCGKALEVYGLNIVQGANVSIYSDNDSDAQKWDLVPTANKTTVDGASYQNYKIVLRYSTKWIVECAGESAVSGTNVDIAADDSTALDREWVFVPVPKMRDGGLYEIVDLDNHGVVWDVEGLSKANGARLMIFSRNGGNNQKFALLKAEHGWRVKSVFSGLYIDREFNKDEQGTKLQQCTTDSNDESDVWAINSFGTTRIDGINCQIVNFASVTNSKMVADVEWAKTTPGTSVMLSVDNSNAGGRNQTFALLPTAAVDDNMPSPHSVGLSPSLGSSTVQTTVAANDQKTRFASWKCPASWATPGSNHYQWRARRRYMSSSRGAWGAWTDWTAWATALCRVSGEQAWLTAPLDVSYEIADSKNLQIQLQVRTAGNDTLQLLTGPSTTADLYAAYRPTVKFTAAGWSPEGLRLQFESDYKWGANALKITAVKLNGKNVLKKPVSFSCNYSKTSVLLAASDLTAVPADGASLAIECQTGTEQAMFADKTQSSTVACAYNAGSQAIDVTVNDGANALVSVKATDLGSDECWFYADGKYVSAYGSNGSYTVAAPFGSTVDVYYMTHSADGTKWGVAHKAHKPSFSPCHAWSWEGGSASLQVRKDEALETSQSKKAVTSTANLNGRKYESVTYGGGYQSSFTAVGNMLEGVTDSTIANFDALLEACKSGKKVMYRDPHGGIQEVAVTEYSRSRQRDDTDLTVTMTQVGD